MVCGCSKSGGMLEFSGYGWIENMSITGVSRPEARYSVPRSSMNRVGECVGREPAGSSLPRADSDPPMTLMSGETSLSASYDAASSARYEAAAASDPSGPNCGSQNRFRFGSLPTMTSRTPGRRRGIDAAYAANCARAAGVVGVTLLNEYTATIGRIPLVAAAMTAFSSAASSAAGGASSGGVQTALSTMARNPACRASSILASGWPLLAASSTAPTTNVSGVSLDRPQPAAATASTATRARRAARDVMSPQLLPAPGSGDAGERTRTSKGRSPTGPKPAASTNSATPARCAGMLT